MILNLLNNLTPEQCVEIAKIAKPDVDWQWHSSSSQGHEVIEKNYSLLMTKWIFQIDTRNNITSRFKLHNSLVTIPISTETIFEIFRYLTGLGVNYWEFLAFKSEDDYEQNHPYFSESFFDYNEMKTFSAKHSKKEKEKFPDYCSNYFKRTITFTSVFN